MAKANKPADLRAKTEDELKSLLLTSRENNSISVFSGRLVKMKVSIV